MQDTAAHCHAAAVASCAPYSAHTTAGTLAAAGTYSIDLAHRTAGRTWMVHLHCQRTTSAIAATVHGTLTARCDEVCTEAAAAVKHRSCGGGSTATSCHDKRACPACMYNMHMGDTSSHGQLLCPGTQNGGMHQLQRRRQRAPHAFDIEAVPTGPPGASGCWAKRHNAHTVTQACSSTASTHSQA